MTTANHIDNMTDTIDVSDLIERFEELRTQREDHEADAAEALSTDETEELAELEALLRDLVGRGGDVQFEGDWYPQALIRDSYFKDYAQELAEETGAIDAAAQWPMNCIDWDQAARELQMDYSAVYIGDIAYWCR